MRRRLRRPTTQLARAGERTPILNVDTPVPEVRFRAVVLNGTPSGAVEVETGDSENPRRQSIPLQEEHRIDGTDLVRISLVPHTDTAVTFLPVETKGSLPFVILGALVVIGGLGLTVIDLLGL